MRRILTVLIAAATLSTAGATAPARAGDGGAIAAGLIGGLALGGLVAAATAPTYGYGYPVYRQRAYRPRYYRVASNCWNERRRSRDDYGNVYFRRVRLCN